VGVIFAAPLFLIGLPAAALPVLFHLFFKVRKKPVPFSSLMFFLRIEPNLHARRKVRELLLLILRTVLILLVVLALARPQLPALAGSGSSAVVVLIDNSASMTRTGAGGRPLLRIASEAAAALIEALATGDRAALALTVADASVTLGEGATTDTAALLAALDQIQPTEASGDAAAALRRAFAILAGSSAPATEVRIFSDLQTSEWNGAAETLTMPAGCRLTVHPLHPEGAAGAVAISRIDPPAGRSIAGRPARSTVILINHRDQVATTQVHLSQDGGDDTTVAVTVPANGEMAVPLVLKPRDPGLTWATVRLDGDSFAGASRAGLVVWSNARAPVLLAGAPGAFGLLPLALAPDGRGDVSGLAPTVVAPEGLVASLGMNAPLMVVATWTSLAQCPQPALQAYVTGGGTLLILPALDAAIEVAAPPWIGATPAAVATLAKPIAGLVLDASLTCWSDLRDGAGQVDVNGLLIARCAVLTPQGGAKAALGLVDGRAILVEKTLGAGRIVSSGIAFHPGWSNLPLKGWSLALVQGLALHQVVDAGRLSRLTAGHSLPPAASDATATRIRSLSGGPLDWQGPREAAPPFARAGVYTVEVTGQQVLTVGVCAAGSEAATDYLDGNTGLLAGLPHRTVPITDARQVVEDWRSVRRGSDLFPWFLLLALAVWALEGWVGTAVRKS